MKIGETFENEAWRVHRFAHAIRITEIRNAGKRGKKCRDLALYDLDFQRVPDAEQEFLARAATKLARDLVDTETMEGWARATGRKLQVMEYRGVDVEESNEAIEIMTDRLKISANKREFSIEDLTDTYNRTTAMDTTRSGARKVHAWIRRNQAVLPVMSFREVMEAIRGLGVRPHQYCAMD